MGGYRASAIVPLVAVLLVVAVATAYAQDQDEDEEPSLGVKQLAEEFSDPLTTLPQLFLKDVYTPSSYGIDGSTNRVIARIIVPRVPR